MTAPAPAVQNMTAPAPSGPRLVKIRTLTTCHLTLPEKPEKELVGPGQVVDVPETEAKEFCDRIFSGGFGMSGEFSENFAETTRHKYKRAERV